MLFYFLMFNILEAQLIMELPSQVFKLQVHSSQRVIELPNATNINLYSLNNDDQCFIKYQSISIENKSLQIIKEENIKRKEYDFEMDNPLNFRQFISLSTIDRNVFLITSDQVFYWIQIKSFDSYPYFKIIWESNMQHYAPTTESQGEFPQLLISNSTQIGFVFYSGGNALTFNLTQMENNKTTMLVQNLLGLKLRDYIGVTQEQNSYIFSAVGLNGLDIYKIEGLTVRFIDNLNNMNVIDLKVLYNEERQEYLIYILDEFTGIQIYQFWKEVITFKILIPLKGIKIAIDTNNGSNIFVAYKIHQRYAVNMIMIDEQLKNYQQITQYFKFRIKDIKVSNQYIIVQGIGFHRILFYKKQGFNNIDDKVQINLGLRDFTFYEDKGTDFIIGMTKEYVFFSKLNVRNSAFYCAITNHSSSQLQYRLTYNVEQLNSNPESNQIIGQNITINVVEVYFLENIHFLIIFVILLIIVLIIALLCLLIKKWKSLIVELEKQIQRMNNKKTSTAVNRELLMPANT